MTLDETDRKILAALQENAGRSISNLAEQLGMTSPPCWRRVNSLKEKGLLKKQVWLIEPNALGLNIFIIATVKLMTHDSEAIKQFRKEIQKIPEIIECFILLGERDALLKIAVPSVQYYDDLFHQRLSQVTGIREMTSSVIMNTVKQTTALPILD